MVKDYGWPVDNRNIKKYCKHCGHELAHIPTGLFDEYTGRAEHYKECRNIRCKMGKLNLERMRHNEKSQV